MDDYKNILNKILEVINYSEDKNVFVSEFIKNVQLQSLIDLLKTLPADKQEEIKNQLSANPDNQEKISEILKNFFSQDQMQESLKNASKEAISKYIQSISSTLSASQKTNLTRVLESAGSGFSAAS